MKRKGNIITRWLLALVLIISIIPSVGINSKAAVSVTEKEYVIDLNDRPTIVTKDNYASLGLKEEHIGYLAIANRNQLYYFAGLVNYEEDVYYDFFDWVEQNNIDFDLWGYSGVLTSDITLNESVLDANGELSSGEYYQWRPIGSHYEQNRIFDGNFDGNNHVVSGMYITDSGYEKLGFFGDASLDFDDDEEKYISNLRIEDSYIGIDNSEEYYVRIGLLGGDCSYRNISNCVAKGLIEYSQPTRMSCVGGVCGNGERCNIEDCSNYANIKIEGEYDDVTNYIGGVAGSAGTIKNCINYGNLEFQNGDMVYVGGVSGAVYCGTALNCTNKGNIIIKDGFLWQPCVGGVVGDFRVNLRGPVREIIIDNFKNEGEINIESEIYNGRIGGLIGNVELYTLKDENGNYLDYSLDVTNSSNTGNISLSKITFNDDYVLAGGIIGYLTKYVYGRGCLNITDCYNTGDITCNVIKLGSAGGIIGFQPDWGLNIDHCFNSGAINKSQDAVELYSGGIIGRLPDEFDSDMSITNTYFDNTKVSESTGIVKDISGDKSTGLPTSSFTSGEVTYLLNDKKTEGTAEDPLKWYQSIGSDMSPVTDPTHEVVISENGKFANPVPAINVSYRTHIQTYGWEGTAGDISTWKKNGAMSGTSGKAKRLEGINIVVNSAESGKIAKLGIQYTTHCQSYGWLPWSANGEMNGTEGEAKRLEAIKIQLTGADSGKFDIYYRVHAQSYGWLGWAKNGEPAGTAGYAKRLEGIQIVVVKKGESFNQKMENITSARTEAFVAKAGNSPIVNYPATSNTNPVVPGADMVNVAYRTHVQKYGWQAWKYNGQMSGTSGEAKRLEGINIELRNKDCTGDIVYTTHVQKYGWQGKLEDQSTWKKNGEMSGTSGEAKRLEAICINLTGEMAQKYDIYYRVHAQSYGWLGWAKNGAPAGTAGYAKRLEGIQIVLVPKNGAAPGNYQGIKSDNNNAYIEKK